MARYDEYTQFLRDCRREYSDRLAFVDAHYRGHICRFCGTSTYVEDPTGLRCPTCHAPVETYIPYRQPSSREEVE